MVPTSAQPARQCLPRFSTTTGVALFASAPRGGLALLSPDSKPGTAADSNWRTAWSGVFSVGPPLCVVEGYYALPFILQVSRTAVWPAGLSQPRALQAGHGRQGASESPGCWEGRTKHRASSLQVGCNALPPTHLLQAGAEGQHRHLCNPRGGRRKSEER